MLRRLIAKGALTYKSKGNVYYYEPVVDREQRVLTECRSFIDRVFGGTVRPMLLQLLQTYELSQKDIVELKKLLEMKGKK